MSTTALSVAERAVVADVVTRHNTARAVIVDGQARWTCEGCAQPLEPSNPAAAFADMTRHQADQVIAAVNVILALRDDYR